LRGFLLDLPVMQAADSLMKFPLTIPGAKQFAAGTVK
jgi:hypothetical protein